MEDLNYGEMMIVEIALLAMLKDLDMTLQSGIAIQEVVAKIESNMLTVRASAGEQLPESLAPDSPVKK